MGKEEIQEKKVALRPHTPKHIKERLPALVRDLFTISSKVIKSFIIV
jgi:hypothetical protein